MDALSLIDDLGTLKHKGKDFIKEEVGMTTSEGGLSRESHRKAGSETETRPKVI